MFTILTSGGNFFCPHVFGGRGSSSSSSLGDPFPIRLVFDLPACLKTQQLLLVWLAGLSGVPRIWQGRSSIHSRLDELVLFLLNGFFC